MNGITYLAAAGALVATSGLGAWAANAAPSDGPSAQEKTTQKHGADDPAGHRHHHRHGADDPAGHHRTAAAQTRHSSAPSSEPGDDHGNHAEPGDDNGGQGELEPGDDNGGQGELEPGHDNGGQGKPEPGDDNGAQGEVEP